MLNASAGWLLRCPSLAWCLPLREPGSPCRLAARWSFTVAAVGSRRHASDTIELVWSVTILKTRTIAEPVFISRHALGNCYRRSALPFSGRGPGGALPLAMHCMSLCIAASIC